MKKQDYYVYVIKDLREKSSKKYIINGIEVVFSNKPILIGKGVGDRMYKHVLEVLNRGTHQNPHFLYYIKKMVSECGSPTTCTRHLFRGLDEKTAFDLETESIAVIGRFCDGDHYSMFYQEERILRGLRICQKKTKIRLKKIVELSERNMVQRTLEKFP